MSRRRNKADYKAEDYKGQAKELETLQDAAPIEVVEEPPVPAPSQQPMPQVNLANAVGDATAPNPDPLASPLAGLNQGRFEQAPDADMILQEMYRVLPSAEIAALLKQM
tara:strand:- start:1088 stop:1414 length:327 start_codon:yes stop_codon:yes gene_type:complete